MTSISIGLYKIADAMQCPLRIEGKKVSGHVDASVTTSLKGLKLPLHIRALEMFSFEQVGVLFHVAGNLYILVAHNEPGAASSAFLIDASKCEADGVKIPPERLFGSKLNLREAVKLLGNAVVASYVRPYGQAWGLLSRK